MNTKLFVTNTCHTKCQLDMGHFDLTFGTFQVLKVPRTKVIKHEPR